MNYLKDILFNISFTGDYVALLTQSLIILILSGIVYLIGWLIFTKLIFRKSSYHLDYQIRLNGLWGWVFFLVVFGVYFYFLIKENSLNDFQIESLNDFLSILPWFLVILMTISFFISQYLSFTRYIKK